MPFNHIYILDILFFYKMESFKFMLAPIEDMTSNALRSICHKYGADITFTEMVRFGSLSTNNASSWERITLKDKTPTVIQIIGHKEYDLKKFLSKFEPTPGFLGFNLNLGCPAPNVVNTGAGCAMVKRINKTRTLVNIIKKKKYGVSIKLRLGLNEFEKKKKVYLNLINSINASFFVVHARHGKQSYNEPADFSVYQECVETGKKIIANGDIKTVEQIESLKKIGVNGAMIGRLAILNPAIFNQLKGIASPPLDKVIKEYTELTEKFDEPFRYRKNILKRNKV
jgi:tRNA-dihydrouridine synthase B